MDESAQSVGASDRLSGAPFTLGVGAPVDVQRRDMTDLGEEQLELESSEAAQRLFGDRMPLALRYVELLTTEGVLRGLIGPREAPRIWSRHIVNCAAVGEMIPYGLSVADIGSGAGLPGIVLAVARPDLRITLVEPLARRATFLSEVVDDLALVGVEILRARAEACIGVLEPVDVVTARAVAPLDRLAVWCLPLAAVGGRLLAIKGGSAADELAEYASAVMRLGGSMPTIWRCGVDLPGPPVTVIEVVRDDLIEASAGSRRNSKARGRR